MDSKHAQDVYLLAYEIFLQIKCLSSARGDCLFLFVLGNITFDFFCALYAVLYLKITLTL